MNPSWVTYRFKELDTDLLYRIIALRESVFVVEQDCAYQEADGLDAYALHLCGFDGAGKLIAYLRCYTVEKNECHVGRIVVPAAERGKGLGHELMEQGLKLVSQHFQGCSIVMEAQSQLAPFYEAYGFRVEGREFLWDGIPHLRMRKND